MARSTINLNIHRYISNLTFYLNHHVLMIHLYSIQGCIYSWNAFANITNHLGSMKVVKDVPLKWTLPVIVILFTNPSFNMWSQTFIRRLFASKYVFIWLSLLIIISKRERMESFLPLVFLVFLHILLVLLIRIFVVIQIIQVYFLPNNFLEGLRPIILDFVLLEVS